MSITILKPEKISFDGNVKEIITELNKMHVAKGDIILLRFNPLNIQIKAALISQYAQKIWESAKGQVSVLPMPQGLSLEKVEAEIVKSKMAEIAREAQAQIDAEGDEDAST